MLNEKINYVIKEVHKTLKRLHEMSPLWEKIIKMIDKFKLASDQIKENTESAYMSFLLFPRRRRSKN